MAEIQHFLLVFDHKADTLIAEDKFGTNSRAALVAYAECEKRYRNDDMIEIVLIGSDSIDTVKITHANYYEGSVGLSKYLQGV